MKRLVYRGRLRFPYGFHTGDGRRLAASDQPLFREPDGSVALAGTSLAGVLRGDLARLLRAAGGPAEQCEDEPGCECVVCRLMGPRAARTRRADEEEERALRASRLVVVGGRSEAPPEVRVRDRVGIDRKTRTAAEKRKYDVEVAEGPFEVPFSLRIDEPGHDEILYLEAALRRLAAGWLFLGGKSGSGLGRAELLRLERTEIDLSDRKALVEHLVSEEPTAGGSPETLVGPGAGGWSEEWELGSSGLELESSGAKEDDSEREAAGEPKEREAWAQLRLRVEIDFPWGFLVNETAEALGRGYDHSYARRPDGVPLLPGSALRGALRARAEQILRTLGGATAACDLHTTGESCHEILEEKNRERKVKGKKALIPKEEVSRLCPACRVFGSGRLVSSIKVTDFHPVEGRSGEVRPQEQVAIDRFTGGAAAGAKFNSEQVDGVTFAGELHVDIGPWRLEPWGLGLLALVLRDLLWGDVALGFGTGRGFNEYRARLIGVERFWIEPPSALAGARLGFATSPGTGRVLEFPQGPLDSPGAVRQAASPELAERLTSWVAALETHVVERARASAGAQGLEAEP